MRPLPAQSGLTLPQFDVLAQLLRHDGPMTASELSQALLVTAGNVTGILDRLKSRALIRRTVNPVDRRVRYLSLTGRGRQNRAA